MAGRYETYISRFGKNSFKKTGHKNHIGTAPAGAAVYTKYNKSV